MSASPATLEPVPISPDRVLEAGGPALAGLLGALERRLVELSADDGTPLGRHAAATVTAGGKRLRPLLVLLAADAGHLDPEGDGAARVLRAAVAVELLHAATLVHDDILDASALRRGRPTVAASAGRRVAVATGDLLFAQAFRELVVNGRPAEVRVLSAASSALAEGELLQRADAWDVALEPERYLERCERKTARLFAAACELGALAAGGDPQGLGVFGGRIGLAFQVLDDVLDVSGPTARTGKPRGADLLDGTVTLPLIFARRRDPHLVDDLRTLSGPADAQRLCERIAATGALDEARAQALALVAEAKAGLPSLAPGQREALELVADATVARYA